MFLFLLSLSIGLFWIVVVKVDLFACIIVQVRRLEAQGIESKHAEAITQALNDSLENVGQSFVAQGEMQKVLIFLPFLQMLLMLHHFHTFIIDTS